MYVERVNNDITTFYSIDCDKFASAFSKSLKLSVIMNEDTIAVLKSFIGKVKYTNNYQNVDVRAKIILESKEGIKIELCTDGYKILINGRATKPNEKFSTFINSLGN
jgi:hypothetical protein